jgi:UDP-N-acetylglucosamine transferase subunit ALG13
VLILLSGPEPQRGILEKKLLQQAKSFNGRVLFVAGIIEPIQTVTKKGNVTYHNFLSTAGVQKAIERSSIVLCRSGYTSIMDLSAMNKKAFFIPTPGQFEQEYLAEHLESQRIAPYATQTDFKMSMLKRVDEYSGLGSLQEETLGLRFLIEDTFSNVNENSDPIPNSLST